jgi:hypothetical protein
MGVLADVGVSAPVSILVSDGSAGGESHNPAYPPGEAGDKQVH